MDASRQLAHDLRALVHTAQLAAAGLRRQGVDGDHLIALEATLNEAARLVAPAHDIEADVRQITAQVVASMQSRIHVQGAQVNRATLPTVLADSNRVRRILHNLISNALSYGGQGVQIDVYEDDGVHVVDNGPGFEANLESTGEGTGLAACREWAAQDDAVIEILDGPGGHVVVHWAKQA